MRNVTTKNEQTVAAARAIKGARGVRQFFYNLSVKFSTLFKRNSGGGKRRFMTRNTRDRLFCISMLVVPLTCFAMFYVAVNINSILLAFKSYTLTNTPEGVVASYDYIGFENFVTFFKSVISEDGVNSVIMLNSFVLYAFQLLVGLPLALLFSFYIYKKRFLSRTFQVVLFFPAIVSAIVMTILFQYFVELAVPEFALSVFDVEGFRLFGSQSSGQWTMIVFYNIWSGFGLSIIMYSNAMSRIPSSVIESARLDGITPLREFWQISVPLIYPTISTFIVTGIAGIFINQANIQGFYGTTEAATRKIQTIGYSIFQSIAKNTNDYTRYPMAATMGVALTVVVAPLVILARWLLEKLGPEVEF